jgi:hypothetical protein
MAKSMKSRTVVYDLKTDTVIESGMYRILVIGDTAKRDVFNVLDKWIKADGKLCDGRQYDLDAGQIRAMNQMPLVTANTVKLMVGLMTMGETGKCPRTYFSCEIEPKFASAAFQEVWHVDASGEWVLLHGNPDKAHANPTVKPTAAAADAAK